MSFNELEVLGTEAPAELLARVGGGSLSLADVDGVHGFSEDEAIAWDGYCQARKSPVTRKAGPEFADPDYDLSVEWRHNRDQLIAAQQRWGDPATRSRVLVINGATRNDGTCPGEMSKSFRLSQIAREVLSGEVEVDLLDLSRLASDFDRHIHPCNGCVSTAMPLCHWPCSCYPNHELGQVNDWMAEIYEKWVSAHGILNVAPTHWYNGREALAVLIHRPHRLLQEAFDTRRGGRPMPARAHCLLKPTCCSVLSHWL